MTTLVEIVYSSRAAVPFDEGDLKALLAKARTKNAAQNVTGILLYHNGSFFQVLEGTEEAVQTVYERVQKDPRHDSLTLLRRRNIAEREFGDWAMAFMTSSTRATQLRAKLEGYSDFMTGGQLNALQNKEESIVPVLTKFRDGRYRHK